ncbi:MAG: sensor histidine kinase [Dictyoglomus turgidum]
MRKFQDLKLKEKLILSFIVVSFIPILILGTVTIIHFRDFALSSSAKEIYNELNLAKLKIMEMTNEAVSIANKLMIDQRLKELLLYKYTSPLEAYLRYSQYKDIENYKTLYAKAIYRIRIYSENPTILENGVFCKTKKEIEQEEWYKLAVQLNGFIIWDLIYQKEDIYPDYYFSLIRLLRDVYNEKFGVLVINLNKLEMKDLLNHTSYETFLVNSDGVVLFSNREDLIGKTFNIDLQRILSEKGYTYEFNNKKYRVFGVYLPLTGYNKDFYLISIVPLEVIMKEPKRMQDFAITIIFIAFISSMVFAGIFSRSMGRRIAILNKAVNEISHGNWDLNIPLQGKDEIGELSENVKMMARNIKNLNELIIKQKDMKFKTLMEQLNPHFLFNTLETIHMIAVCNDQKEIADVALRLGKILRRSLEAKGKPVSIEWELDLIRNYLEIQKYRFKDLDYKIEIFTDIREVYILPFLIQPIVENSVVHGIEPKKGRGIIEIKIYRKEDYLVISVEDNGVGMENLELEKILNEDQENYSKIGLKNTLERIKLFYGNEYGLKIETQKNVGTKVDIILPYATLRKERVDV